MNRHSVFVFLFLILWLAFSLSGCHSVSETPSEPTISQSPDSILTTATHPSLATSLPSPTGSPKPTITSPSKLTPTPTMAIVPTLLPDQKQALINELIENNGGCRFPCWWGITPGKTTWQEAISFFKTFAYEISTYVLPNGGNSAAVWLYSPPNEALYPLIGISLMAPQGIIQEIVVEGFGKTDSYSLSQLLSDYGQPEEIWLDTASTNPENKPPISILVFYPKQGIFALYQADGQIMNGMIRGCIKSFPSAAHLTFWYPEHEITLSEAIEKSGLGFSDQIRRLSEVTNMDEEAFYYTFKDENKPVCLETPKKLWLGLYGETPSP